MTSDEELVRIVTDPRLTPEAVRVVLYVRSLGPHGQEFGVAGEDLSILLHGGEKPVRAAVARAVHCGYLASRFGGRAGHKLTFLGCSENDSPRGGNPDPPAEEMTPPGEGITGNDSPRGGNSEPAGGGFMGGETPPTSQPTNPPAGSRTSKATAVELDPLRAYLGEHAGAVDVFAASAEHRGSWAAALLGKYGPNGTLRHFWRGIPAEREPAIVADALLNYASDSGGKGYDARLFEAYLRRSRDGAPEKPARASPRADVAPDSQSARIMARSSDPTPGAGRAQQPRGNAEPAPITVDPFAQYRDRIAALPLEEQERIREQARSRAPAGASEQYIEGVFQSLALAAINHPNRKAG